MGRNLALQQHAYSSSQNSVHTTPVLAVDGDMDAWAPNVFQSAAAQRNGNTAEWLAVRLASNVDNPTVVVHARDCCTVDFGGQLNVFISSSVAGRDASFDRAVQCGSVQVGDGGHQTVQCSGSGDTIFVGTSSALRTGGSLSVSEIQVFGVDALDSTRMVGFEVMTDAASVDAVRAALVGLSLGRFVPGSPVSVQSHDVVQYSPSFTCATQLAACPLNSNCVNLVDQGFICECALDFTGTRPACNALAQSGSSTLIASGSQILLQTSGGRYIRAAQPPTDAGATSPAVGAIGAVSQVGVPAGTGSFRDALTDHWQLETFTIVGGQRPAIPTPTADHPLDWL